MTPVPRAVLRRRASDDPRAECYQRIRDCMKDGIHEYYRVHDDRLGDLRHSDAMVASQEGLRCIFEVLDDYDLHFRQPTPAPDPTTEKAVSGS